MDNRANNSIHELFSRGSTPPIPQQAQHQQFPSTSSLSHSSSPSEIDTLFHQLSSASGQQQSQPQSGPDNYGNSSPTTPTSTMASEASITSPIASPNTTADRQSALLSLLGGPSAANARAVGPQQPQQVPTPPSSSAARSGASPNHNEASGKILLEQLMAG